MKCTWCEKEVEYKEDEVVINIPKIMGTVLMPALENPRVIFEFLDFIFCNVECAKSQLDRNFGD